MPLDKDRWGPKTAQDLKSYSSSTFPPDRLTFVTDSELEEVWKIITGDAKDEINDHADIMLGAADILVNPGSFVENNPTPNTPITGQGQNAAVTLEMKIK